MGYLNFTLSALRFIMVDLTLSSVRTLGNKTNVGSANISFKVFFVCSGPFFLSIFTNANENIVCDIHTNANM